MALNAAAIDTRIKATVTVTMYDMSRVNANGYFDGAPYRRYNKYSIGKLLGKCSNIYLSSPAYLPTKGRQEYSTLESHKSISYQIATEW